MAKKKPWLAVLLNILLTGLGYLYLGKRKVFGILLMVVELIGVIWVFTEPLAFQIMKNGWIGLASFLIVIAFGIDAYEEAKKTK